MSRVSYLWAISSPTVGNSPQNGGFFPGKPYIDRGISGQTTPQMLLRFRPDVIALKIPKPSSFSLEPMTSPETRALWHWRKRKAISLPCQNSRTHMESTLYLLLLRPLVISPIPKEKKSIQTKRRPPQKILTLNQWIKNLCGGAWRRLFELFPQCPTIRAR